MQALFFFKKIERSREARVQGTLKNPRREKKAAKLTTIFLIYFLLRAYFQKACSMGI